MAPGDRQGESKPNPDPPTGEAESGDREALDIDPPETPLRDRLPLDSRGRAPAGVDVDGRVRDRLGRLTPSRFNWLKLLRAVPSLFAGAKPPFGKKVPDDFYTQDADEDGTVVYVIACPCGAEPRVPLAGCTECRCWRFYLAVGGSVRVANSPRPWKL